jgi:hypothetical protein
MRILLDQQAARTTTAISLIRQIVSVVSSRRVYQKLGISRNSEKTTSAYEINNYVSVITSMDEISEGPVHLCCSENLVQK